MRVLVASLMLGVSSGAVLADDSYYAGFELGITKANRQTLENSTSGLSLTDKKNPNLMGGLYVGKILGKWRVEGEYAIRTNYYDSMNVKNAGGLGLDGGYNLAGGSQKTSALMVNTWYEFADLDGWKALVGAGAGLASFEVNRMRSGKTLVNDDRDTAFAAQGMVQLLKPFKNGMEFGVGYRHFRTNSQSFETYAGSSRYKAVNNELFARLSWRFGETAKPRQAEPVRQAPEPVVAPTPVRVETPQVVEEKKPEPKPVALPGPFMVFFDFDKSDITPEAARIIKAAAKAFKEHKAVRIMATGHADRSGTEAYNMRLSQRRADAVKAALIAEGVSASSIMTAAKGETSPLVATDDGVREPQNRRTEIVLKR